MKTHKLIFLLCAFAISSSIIHAQTQFVIIIPAYNCASWYTWNLQSVFEQDYPDYRVVYIDDASTDSTSFLVKQFVQLHKQTHRFTLVSNTNNLGQLANRYNAVHSCKDHEVMVMLDGDDAFAHNRVLSTLAEYYNNPTTWMTYSQHKQCCLFCMKGNARFAPHRCIHSQHIQWNIPYSPEQYTNNAFRSGFKGPMHLRTFYAWLFKRIKAEDLQVDGKFLRLGTDTATFFPLIEMAGVHAVYIPEVLYLYNQSNLLSYKDHDRTQRRAQFVKELEKRKPYEPLTGGDVCVIPDSDPESDEVILMKIRISSNLEPESSSG